MKYFVIGWIIGLIIVIYITVIDTRKTVNLIWESQLLTEKMVHNIVEYRNNLGLE